MFEAWKNWEKGHGDGDLLGKLGERCGDMALQCSDTAGYLSRLNQRIQRGSTRLHDLQANMAQLSANQLESNFASEELQRTASRAQTVIAEGSNVAARSLDEFAGLIAHVMSLEEKLRAFLDIIGTVGTISDELGSIAKQTRMLGINAAIEAGRGGEATKGFAVVADEIRRLATQAGDSTSSVSEKLAQLDQSARGLIGGVAAGIDIGRQTSGQIDRIRSVMTEISVLITQFQQRSEAISHCNREGAEDVAILKDGLEQFCASAEESAREVDTARLRLDELEGETNQMLNLTAHSQVQTRNSPYIAQALAAASDITGLIDTALATDQLSMAELFDTDYQPLPNSDPLQYHTRFVSFADIWVRPVLDRHTDRDSSIVGCCLVDMNGFLPTHISARSQRQRPGDRQWNLENSRNRQIFMDNQTRHALDNEGDFFLYTYRQDFGDGHYRALRSVLVPLSFKGRRWGLFELGYLI
jgi:methyl-accepting chemotaxis protein